MYVRGKMGNVAMRVMWPLGVSHKLYVQSKKNIYIKYAH